MQISIYLLCFLQFGELKSANKLIFTVLFAILIKSRYLRSIQISAVVLVRREPVIVFFFVSLSLRLHENPKK